MPEPLIGIDLGTTNSVVAYMDAHGRPTSIPNPDGDLITPSVVFFEENGPAIVGKEAAKAGILEPRCAAELVKRDMGKPFFHHPIRGKKFPPAAISGVILHHLVHYASEQVGKFKRAVVTVPAYFNEPRRKATMDAGRMAGLTEVELLNEPTAAALAFGFEMGVFTGDGKINQIETKVPGQYTLLVYDLGGGTFDVTLMRIRDRHFQALVCDGDVQLGGKDWDERVVKYALAAFQEQFGVDASTSPETIKQLWADAEELKKALSQRAKTTLRLAHEGNRLNLEISREKFYELTKDLLGRTRMTCELVMMEAKMGWEKVDAILLVGGSSRMPMVHDMLIELSGVEPSRAVSPDHAVAQGAALYAQMLWGGDGSEGKVRDAVKKTWHAEITNINSHSLGIVGRDKKTMQRRVSILIPKNTAIPHSNSKVFKTRAAGQTKIYIRIVEGESSNPDHCAQIGECRLEGLPADLPEDWPVTVTFAYRRDGRIFLEAEVKGHKPFQLEIDRKQEISDAEAEDWAQELIGDMWDDDDIDLDDPKASKAPKPSPSSEKPSKSPLPPSRVQVARLKPKPEE